VAPSAAPLRAVQRRASGPSLTVGPISLAGARACPMGSIAGNTLPRLKRCWVAGKLDGPDDDDDDNDEDDDSDDL
jgi:hypothetical protein